MKVAVFLIVCFAMAANADILDDMKAKFQEFKTKVSELAEKAAAKFSEEKELAMDEIKSHINAQTLAEIKSFLTICKDEPEQVGKDAQPVQKACAFIKEHWVEVQAKLKVVELMAAEKWAKFKQEISFDFMILKEVAIQKWEHAKIKLQEIKAGAKTAWDKFSAAVKEGWEKLTAAVKAKVDQWLPAAKEKFAKLKEAAKAKWNAIKEKAGELAKEAKEEFDKIKQDIKQEIEQLKPEVKEAEKEVQEVLTL